MLMSEAFPSEYLRAADLQNRQVRAVIDRVELREVGDDHKPVLFFQNKEKGVVLNKTNATMIAAAYGDETDAWIGKEIILFSMMVSFQGRMQPGIRVQIPQPRKPAGQARPKNQVTSGQQPAPASEENPADGLNDDIPW